MKAIKKMKDCISKIWDDIKESFFPSKEMDIRDFVEQVLKHFEQGLKHSSTDQDIEFPMVFNILLCSDDYNRLKQIIPGHLNGIITGFYRIIYEKKKSLPGASVKNLNKYWVFSFSESDNVSKGVVEIKMYMYGTDIRAADIDAQLDGDGSDESKVDPNDGGLGSLAGTAFNQDVLDGGLKHRNKQYSFDFDINQILNPNTTNRSSNTGRSLAVITWESDKNHNRSARPFVMQEDTISISNSEDTRNNPSGLLKIDDDTIEKDHVQIEYLESEKKFRMCAFAKGVVLNQQSIDISQGQNIKWYSLPKKSAIIIRDYVIIKFVAS